MAPNTVLLDAYEADKEASVESSREWFAREPNQGFSIGDMNTVIT